MMSSYFLSKFFHYYQKKSFQTNTETKKNNEPHRKNCIYMKEVLHFIIFREKKCASIYASICP